MKKIMSRFLVTFALLVSISVPFTSDAFWQNFEVSISPFNQISQQVGAVLGASSLTDSQIQSILSLLQSFGADQTTINNVRVSLGGSVPITPGAGGALSLSVATTPSDQVVVPGTPQFAVVNINASTIGSSEDVLLPGISLVYTDNAPSDPTNCMAFTATNGLSPSNIINPNNNGAAPQSYNVSFDTPLIIPKGTVQVIHWKCVIPSSATAGSFRFGLLSGISIVAKGAASGESIIPSITTNYGPTVTISTAASSLSVNTSPASDSYRLVAAGTQNTTMGAYRLQALAQPVRLLSLGLKLTSGSANDLVRVSVWDGATKVGDAFFTGGNTTATSTFSQPVIIPANSTKDLTIKADLSDIGVVQPVTASGSLVQINFLNAEAYGNTSGAAVKTSGSTAVAGVRIMKAYPVVGLMDLPSTGLQDGRLLRFKVNAEHGPISLGSISLRLAGLAPNTNGQVDLYGYTDINYSSPISGFTSGGINGLAVTSASPGGYLNFPTPVHIPTGATRYFEVRDSTKGTGVTNTTVLVTTLLGQPSFPGSGFAGLSTFASFFTGKEYAFIWSPNSLNTPTFATADWTTGQNVPGLPSSGLSQTRTGGGVSATTIALTQPKNDTVITVGDPIPVSWSFTGAPLNTQVELKLVNTQPSNPSTGNLSGGSWQGSAITSTSGSGSYNWPTGYSQLDYTGTYQLTAYLRECDPAGCNYYYGPRTVYATSTPVTFLVKAKTVTPDQATVSSTGYYEGKFYIKSTLSDAGEAHRTLYRGTTVTIGNAYYSLISNSGVGNFYIPSEFATVVKVGDAVEVKPPTATVTAMSYYEGKFYIKTTQSGDGQLYRTVTSGTTFIVGGKTYLTTSGTGVGNIYLPSDAASYVQVGFPVEKQ